MSRGMRFLVMVLLVVAFAAGFAVAAYNPGGIVPTTTPVARAAKPVQKQQIITITGSTDLLETMTVDSWLKDGWVVDRVVTRKRPVSVNASIPLYLESYDYILRLDQ